MRYVLITLLVATVASVATQITLYAIRNTPDEAVSSAGDQTTEEKSAIVWKTRYQKCLKQKRLIPIPVYQDNTQCEDDLAEAQDALKAVYAWCDAHCPEELEDCQRALYDAQNLLMFGDY